MLRLRDYRSRAKGLPDLLPYAALVAPGVVLCKDGSLLAAWEFRGQDTASSTPEEMAFVSAQVNAAAKQLGSGWMLHVDALRSRERAYSRPDESHFPDPVTAAIDAERRAFFRGDACHATRTVLTVTWRPSFGDAALDKATTSGRAERNHLERSLETFAYSLQAIEDSLASVLRLERLGEYEDSDADSADEIEVEGGLHSALLSHLKHCVTGEEQPVRVPATPMYLDALIGGEDLVGGLAPRLGERGLAVLSIDGLPQESWPGMLAALDSLPMPYRFSTRFLCLDQLDATREIAVYRKAWRQQIFRFFDQFFNNPNARANVDAQRMTEDADEALVEVQGGYVGAGFLTSTIILMHEDRETLQDWARELRRAVQVLGFGCRIESINALEAWLGSHPGNGFANLRRLLVNTLNLADMLPLASVWTGAETCPCPYYPAGSPPLMVCTTDGATPFRFNLHAGDVGHTLIFGPTGAGKSTLLALIAAQFRRYKDATITAFDKGKSLYPLCLGAGGSHYTVGADALAFAPLQRIDAADSERAWAAEWLATLATLQGVTVLPGHRTALRTALEGLAANPAHLRSLTDFVHVLQDAELREALTQYTSKGALSGLLDAAEDDLAVSPFMVFEIEELMRLGEANLVPVLLYLFHRIEGGLRGQPALLLLDEAWLMLGHPVFREKLREWLKVMRKANCAVVLATQSLSDAARSGVLDVLIESCPTTIFLPNLTARQEGQRELYLGMGLNARQLDIIATATPKRDYYMVAPAGRRLLQLALGPKALAFVGASDKASLARIHALHTQHGPAWPDHWLHERGVS